MINAKNKNFVIHRRLILTIVIKIDDRKNENFIIVNKTNDANETKKKNEIIVIDEATKKIINQNRYLTKTFSTTLIIMIFNS